MNGKPDERRWIFLLQVFWADACRVAERDPNILLILDESPLLGRFIEKEEGK